MVFSAVAASDFSTGTLVFVVTLTAAPRTRCYCFTASFHCVLISKACLAAHWSFIIFVNLIFCLSSRDFYESRWFVFYDSQ